MALHGAVNLKVGQYATKVTPTEEDLKALHLLRKTITNKATFYSAVESFVPQKVFRRAEPDYSQGGWKGLGFCFTSGLTDVEWELLKRFLMLNFRLVGDMIGCCDTSFGATDLPRPIDCQSFTGLRYHLCQ